MRPRKWSKETGYRLLKLVYHNGFKVSHFRAVERAARKGGSMIELSGGYVVVQVSGKRFVLKMRYNGIRKGRHEDCYRVISNHTSFEDALKAFQRLSQGIDDRDSIIPVAEYIKRLEEANAKTAEVIQNSLIQHFYMDIPAAKGEEASPLHPIAELIPIGRNNAIKREKLVERCVGAGLVDPNAKESTKDRATRELIRKARREYVILNLSDGDGYYRVSREDMQDLQRYIRQEENRAKASFKNLSLAKKLYEDYKHGRIKA